MDYGDRITVPDYGGITDYGDSALICQVWVAPLERGAEMSDDANNAELATQIQPCGHIRYGV